MNNRSKRLFDIIGSMFFLIVLSPVMLAIALAIFLIDGSPILFRHDRIGKDGRVFQCIKFRTMIRNSREALEDHLERSPQARAEWAESHKLKDDPRILPGIGNFLRKTSLDEIPQFANVLRGEMSLVGPRPIVSDEMDRYGKDLSSYLSARPGITGPWQVSGRSDMSYPERVSMDVHYVNNQSLMSDVLICIRTVGAVAARRGAV